MDTEEENTIIENEFLGIYSHGKNQDEAEEMFAQDFEYIYTRYNELTDDKLTNEVKLIKDYLNNVVTEVQVAKEEQ